MNYKHEDGTPFTKEEFLQKLKTDKEFNDEFGNKGIDQITNLINDLKTNPDSRRLMVNSWNVGQLSEMVLPPCHYGFQVYTRELSLEERNKWAWDNWGITCEMESVLDEQEVPKRAISLMWNQRSVDTPLGLPFNIASYALLLEIIAKTVNMIPDELIANLGDCHIYTNQINGIKEQLGRELTYNERYDIWFKNNFETGMEYNPDIVPDFDNPYYEPTPKYSREPYPLPKLIINNEFWPTQSGECGIGELTDNIDHLIKEMRIEDFILENYQSHPAIKMPLSN